MALDPTDPFFEGAIRSIIQEEIGSLPMLVRQLQIKALPTYLAADVPPAADHTGELVFVSDGGIGSWFQGSNGSSWVSLG